MLPPLPTICSSQLLGQVFTHASLNARSQDGPICDNEGLAHIGDQVLGLAVTDLIQERYKFLHVGPTSKVRDHVKCAVSLAEIAVQYGLHKRLRAKDRRLMDVQSVQVNLFKAYVGALFREQDIEPVKKWLNPLFEPLVDEAYRSERELYLPESATTLETPPLTPPPSPPSQRTAPAPSLAADGPNEAGVTVRSGRSELNTTRNRPTVQHHSLAAGAPPGGSDRSNGQRGRRGMALQGGNADVPDSSRAHCTSNALPRRRSPAASKSTENKGKRQKLE